MPSNVVHFERDGSNVLQLVQRIAAPPEAIWRAFTDADDLSAWFTTGAKSDVVVGGAYSNDDTDHGTFVELDPPHRVVFTWDNDRHCPGTLVSITIASRDAGCDVTLEHSGLASSSDALGMEEGWRFALDSLQSWLENGTRIWHEDWLAANRGDAGG